MKNEENKNKRWNGKGPELVQSDESRSHIEDTQDIGKVDRIRI